MAARRAVFKKSSPNGKLTAYLARRDFYDDLTTVDPVSGVCLVDRGYVGPERKVFAHVRCGFRYGPKAMDDIMAGVKFNKEFFLACTQVYPREKGKEPEKWSALQEKLMDKLGDDAFPFTFQLPHDVPASIMLQQPDSLDPQAQPCGVEYQVILHVAKRKDELPQKHSAVRMSIRRLTFMRQLDRPLRLPHQEISKNFHLHSGAVRVEGTLDREVYHHGQPVLVTVAIDNFSSNTVKELNLQVVQFIEVTLFQEKNFQIVICEHDVHEGFPLAAGHSGWCETFKLRPSLEGNRDKNGLALDGKLKHMDTNLASSTLLRDFRNKNNIGLIVQYMVIIRARTGFGGRDVKLEIPFNMSHPKPLDGSEAAQKHEDFVIKQFGRSKVTRQETAAECVDM